MFENFSRTESLLLEEDTAYSVALAIFAYPERRISCLVVDFPCSVTALENDFFKSAAHGIVHYLLNSGRDSDSFE